MPRKRPLRPKVMLIMKTTMMTASRRLHEGVQEVYVRNDDEAEKVEMMPWKRPSRPKVMLIMKTTMMTLIVETTLRGPAR